MSDIEYTFGFSLPIDVIIPASRPGEQTLSLRLGELEDCEAVACVNIEDDGDWYVEEFQVRGLKGLTRDGETVEGDLHLDPRRSERNYGWVLDAVQAEFKAAYHSVDIERMVRAEIADDDAPTYREQESAIYHQSVL